MQQASWLTRHKVVDSLHFKESVRSRPSTFTPECWEELKVFLPGAKYAGRQRRQRLEEGERGCGDHPQLRMGLRMDLIDLLGLHSAPACPHEAIPTTRDVSDDDRRRQGTMHRPAMHLRLPEVGTCCCGG